MRMIALVIDNNIDVYELAAFSTLRRLKSCKVVDWFVLNDFDVSLRDE